VKATAATHLFTPLSMTQLNVLEKLPKTKKATWSFMARTAIFGEKAVSETFRFHPEDNVRITLIIEANASQKYGNYYEKISKNIIW
jgi:hypothetical protein